MAQLFKSTPGTLSVAYKREDVLLTWSSGNDSVKITENITMSQFQLLDRYVKEYNYSRMNNTDGEIFSVNMLSSLSHSVWSAYSLL